LRGTSPLTVTIDHPNRWRIEQFLKLESSENISAAVRDLINRGWCAYVDQAVAKAAPHMKRAA
jgi:hypothetical protein